MKKILATTVAFGVLAFAGSALALSWSWIDGNNNQHDYAVISGNLTWDLAHDALSTGTYLATITSQDEQDALTSAMVSESGEYWLGGIQATSNGGPDLDWSWADTGEDFCYTNWSSGEPNDWNGTNEAYIGTWSSYGWEWNDEHGSANIAGYIVEKGEAYAPNCAPVPEPATMLLFGTGLAGLVGFSRKRSKKS